MDAVEELISTGHGRLMGKRPIRVGDKNLDTIVDASMQTIRDTYRDQDSEEADDC